MLTNNDSVSFVATLDAAVSRAFYEDSLGLKLVSDEHFALVFDLNGHMLRIAKVDQLVPAKHTVLGWHVADIAATVKKLVERGVVFERFDGMAQDDVGIWLSPAGAKVAWFKDPDGNNLSLTQFENGNAS
jgi:catechol 2,3-dioxygenase-like lactoylglutathione lyase family enzyme